MNNHDPKAGDIYVGRFATYRIINNDGYRCYCIILENDTISMRSVYNDYFKKSCTYLGKSEYNIKDLFKRKGVN